MRKNLGYVRVSTREQSREGHSLKQQEESVKNYAKAINIKNVQILVDGGYSARSLSKDQVINI